MAHFGRQACRLVFAPGLRRLIGDFSRFAGSRVRARVRACEARSGAKVSWWRWNRPWCFSGCRLVCWRVPAGFRRLSRACFVSPGCRSACRIRRPGSVANLAFPGIKPLISLALFLDLRPDFPLKESASGEYGEATVAFTTSRDASPDSRRPGVFAWGHSPRSGKLEGFLRLSVPRREGFASLKLPRILLDNSAGGLPGQKPGRRRAPPPGVAKKKLELFP